MDMKRSLQLGNYVSSGLAPLELPKGPFSPLSCVPFHYLYKLFPIKIHAYCNAFQTPLSTALSTEGLFDFVLYLFFAFWEPQKYI